MMDGTPLNHCLSGLLNIILLIIPGIPHSSRCAGFITNDNISEMTIISALFRSCIFEESA